MVCGPRMVPRSRICAVDAQVSTDWAASVLRFTWTSPDVSSMMVKMSGVAALSMPGIGVGYPIDPLRELVRDEQWQNQDRCILGRMTEDSHVSRTSGAASEALVLMESGASPGEVGNHDPALNAGWNLRTR